MRSSICSIRIAAPGGKEPDEAAQSAIVLMKAEVELRKGDKENIDQAHQLLLDADDEVPDASRRFGRLWPPSPSGAKARRQP